MYVCDFVFIKFLCTVTKLGLVSPEPSIAIEPFTSCIETIIGIYSFLKNCIIDMW